MTVRGPGENKEKNPQKIVFFTERAALAVHELDDGGQDEGDGLGGLARVELLGQPRRHHLALDLAVVPVPRRAHAVSEGELETFGDQLRPRAVAAHVHAQPLHRAQT